MKPIASPAIPRREREKECDVRAGMPIAAQRHNGG